MGRSRAAQAALPLPPAPEPFPEHAKLHPHLKDNWAIREFLFWMLSQDRIDMITFDQVNDLLLEFRGIDKIAYEVEAAQLKIQYQWLYDQFEVDSSEVCPPEPVTKIRLKGAQATQDTLVRAALPDRGPNDGLAFLLSKIRGGGDGAGKA